MNTSKLLILLRNVAIGVILAALFLLYAWMEHADVVAGAVTG